jgi:hypothetical protein
MTQLSRHPSILGARHDRGPMESLSSDGMRNALLAAMPSRARRFLAASATLAFASLGGVALAQTPVDGPHPPPDPGQDPQLAAVPPPIPSPPSTRHGLLVLPYLGVHSYQNADMADYAPGPRFGALFGGRLSHWLSLNGELTVDVSYMPNSSSAGNLKEDSEYYLDLAFSPLAHLARGPVELVAGPKVGFFRAATSFSGSSAAVSGESTSLWGITAGLNAGAFVPVGGFVELGGLLSIEARDAREYCQTPSGGAQTCTTNEVYQSTTVLHTATLVGATIAALF